MNKKCGFCDRPPRTNCWQGQMDYADGSSRPCPNWEAKMDEVAGLDPEQEAQWRARLR